MKGRNVREKSCQGKNEQEKMMRMENWMEKNCGKVKHESQTESCEDGEKE